MNTELVRETLRQHAADAPSGAILLYAVRTRVRRRRRNRQFTVVGAAAVAVALALAGPAVWLRGTAEEPANPAQSAQPAPPTQPAETVPAETPPADPAALMPSSYQVGAFPFTPGWTPPGTNEPIVYTVEPDHLFLAHETPDGGYAIHVEVSPVDPEVELYAVDGETVPPGDPVTVQGRQGELRDTYFGQPALVWQHRPDLWVKVEGENAGDLLRYAEALVEQPLPVLPPFTLDLVPAGAELSSVQPDAMRFVMRDEAACAALAEMSRAELDELYRTDLADVPVCIIGQFIVRLFQGGPGAEVPANFLPGYGTEVISGDEPEPPRETIQVGEHEAELIGDNNLHVFVGDGTALGVTALGELTLSPEELVDVALGVQIMPDARSIFE